MKGESNDIYSSFNDNGYWISNFSGTKIPNPTIL